MIQKLATPLCFTNVIKACLAFSTCGLLPCFLEGFVPSFGAEKG
jgi:hypothetical protein